MTFRETLRRHLQAIQERDLEAHRGWFAVQGWTLQASEVEVFESADLGVAVLRLDYREPPATHSRSYLSLVFQNRNGRWVMVQDQNTPIR